MPEPNRQMDSRSLNLSTSQLIDEGRKKNKKRKVKDLAASLKITHERRKMLFIVV